MKWTEAQLKDMAQRVLDTLDGLGSKGSDVVLDICDRTGMMPLDVLYYIRGLAK